MNFGKNFACIGHVFVSFCACVLRLLIKGLNVLLYIRKEGPYHFFLWSAEWPCFVTYSIIMCNETTIAPYGLNISLPGFRGSGFIRFQSCEA